jgi:hypothetical protein
MTTHDEELLALRQVAEAARSVNETFRAVGADRNGLVRWEVSATAMKSLILALGALDVAETDPDRSRRLRAFAAQVKENPPPMESL